MTASTSSTSTSRATRDISQRRWLTGRRPPTDGDDRDDGDRAGRELRALALAVGPDRAAEVRRLLTEVTVGAGTTVPQQLRITRQGFFVLSGRLAITVADHPVAVMGPGSFFGGSDSSHIRGSVVPRVHALGPVVLGVAGHLELPVIHRLVPDLPTFTMAATDDAGIPPASTADDRQHADDDVMGLGLLDRIAS